MVWENAGTKLMGRVLKMVMGSMVSQNADRIMVALCRWYKYNDTSDIWYKSCNERGHNVKKSVCFMISYVVD